MPLSIADTKYGFVQDSLGAHLARTIMVDELYHLFGACDATLETPGYRKAIVDENVLLKKTAGTRLESYRRLHQLYGLQPSLLIFRAMRELWSYTDDGRPLLALLCALGRDQVLRCTADLMIETPEGDNLTAKSFEAVIEKKFPGRLNAKTLASAGQNVASSWTQSGHLHGLSKKTRRLVVAEPVVVAYALLLAYLAGARGDALFESNWLKILDTPTHTARAFAQQAAQQGWLEYRHSGQVTDITFRHFLAEDKR
ncbi:MAG TPA: hypothetical protein VKF38_14905 [Anaerolineaceae bacterium]|nr:hypothetical protein [Anaerolineaceae bacterium]